MNFNFMLTDWQLKKAKSVNTFDNLSCSIFQFYYFNWQLVNFPHDVKTKFIVYYIQYCTSKYINLFSYMHINVFTNLFNFCCPFTSIFDNSVER